MIVPEHRFNVGDRVRVLTTGQTGTVTVVSGVMGGIFDAVQVYRIRLDEPDGDGKTERPANELNLEPLDDARSE